MIITKQRSMVMQFFNDHPNEHPTAEDIYSYVKCLDASIGIATVYRNLHKLVEIKMLRELKIEKQSVHYDLATHEHYHFICDVCGQIENFVIDELLRIQETVEKEVHGIVKEKDLVFHGICATCLTKT